MFGLITSTNASRLLCTDIAGAGSGIVLAPTDRARERHGDRLDRDFELRQDDPCAADAPHAALDVRGGQQPVGADAASICLSPALST